MRIATILRAQFLVLMSAAAVHAASIEWLAAKTRAYGVSSDGRFVVGSGAETEAGLRPFTWTAAEGMTPLPALGQGVAHAVSTDGAVIVGNDTIGALWGRVWINGVATPIGAPPGGSSTFTFLRDVADDGSFGVGQSGGADGGQIAFTWTSASGSVALPRLGTNPRRSNAIGISGDGQTIVGQSGSDDGKEVPVRWTASGVSAIATVQGGAAAASHDASVIVGFFGDIYHEPFRWTAATGIVGLGTLGRLYGIANDVSADGSVVVGTLSTGIVDKDDAFIWTPTGGTQFLTNFLAERGVQLGNAEMLRAEGISADGTVIVGTGRINGIFHGFVVSIPEPSSAGAVIAVAAFCLSRRSVRCRQQS